MRIGLLVPSVGKFGNKGFYNLQEVGLAKAFGNQGHTVEVYKCVGKDAVNKREKIAENVHLNMIAVPTVGNNSVFSCEKRLSRDLDVLVCFSDVQIRTSAVYRWARLAFRFSIRASSLACFSRSMLTTASGARVTKFSFASFAF